eukprot:gene8969-18561_t
MPGLFKFGNWNENNLNPLSRINWRASLVPAAAVIPAPIAYTKVVAVKKLVSASILGENVSGISLSGTVSSSFTVMINRDSWGYSYSIVRGEILGFMEDELLRKHLPNMFSLIKNE